MKHTMITELRVKEISADDWSRPRLQDLDREAIYTDTEFGAECGFNIPGDWHTTTADWGEPINRIRKDIKFILIKTKIITNVMLPIE